MKLNDLFRKIIIRSGQFLIDRNNIEMDEDRFKLLVEDTLSIFNQFCPFETHFFVANTGLKAFPITDEFIEAQTGMNIGVPDWVSDAHPSAINGIASSIVLGKLNPYYNPDLIDKAHMPFTYRKPLLYLSSGGNWDIHGVWNHKIVESFDENDGYEFTIPTMEQAPNRDKFIKLLQGLFLQGIGRSRRAFTMNDLPITMDASELAGEGKDLEQEAYDDLENIQKIWLAW